MSIDSIVNVQISKETATVSRTGYGVPLVLTYHTKDSSRVLEFSEASDMLVAGGGPFASSDMAYKLAVAEFSQSPRPPSVLVGRRLNPTIRTVVVTPRAGVINGETLPRGTALYRCTIDGVNFDFTTDGTATVAEITAGLVPLINAGTVNVLATDNTTALTIEKAVTPGGVATAGIAFEIAYDRSLMTVIDTTPAAVGGTLAEEIANIRNINDDWYGITGDWFGKTEILAVAATIEAMPKLHGAATSDDDCYDAVAATDTLSLLQTDGYARTFCFHHTDPGKGVAAAMFGRNLPQDPGSTTWKFKTLNGISTVKYTPTEATALENKNGMRYVVVHGRAITCDGKTSSGEFIDITRFVDFLMSRMQESVFLPLVNNEKLSFTNKGGIAIVETEVRGTLLLGIRVGGIAREPAFTVTVPNAIVGSENGVQANDKANRILTGVEFCATLAGAIHEIQIRGKLVV